MELTAEQESAVRERGRDVLVTAGAGSGKTRVLVERYLSLLENLSIGQIVAVTFTDAAASEMRDRVRRAVMSRPEFERHLADLDSARIGTVHSLCLQILRENPVEAGIDPASSVLSDDEEEAERLSACMDAIEAAAEEQGPRLAALLGLGIRQVANELPRMVARRNEVEAAYSALGGASKGDWATRIRGTLDQYVIGLVEAKRAWLAEKCGWLVDARQDNEPDKLTPIVDAHLQSLGDPWEGDAEDLLRRLAEAALLPGPGGFGGRAAWNAPPQEVRQALREIRAIHAEIAAFQWTDADAAAIVVLDSLHALFRDACERFKERKKDLSALDYLDLELKAIELLRTSPETAAAYRARFKHVLVDEVQDLNPTQFEFLELLTRTPHSNDKLSGPERFYVGDIKQAIYRFRGSDVRNVSRLEKDIKQLGGTTLSLSESFRAHDPLIQTLNGVFADVFANAEADYEARMQPMTGRRVEAPSQMHVTVLPIGKAYADNQGEGNPSARERTRMEAHAVAHQISVLLDEGAPVWDAEEGRARPARPEDIVILLRRFIHVAEFERALEGQGVPYRASAGGGFFDRQEIIDLTNLMEWLSDAQNDLALVGVLRSPFFAIDDESLLMLRNAEGSLLENLANPPANLSESSCQVCGHAADVMRKLREEAHSSSPEDLLNLALELTNVEAAWAPLQGGEQVIANIRRFVALARTLAGKSLDEFVEHVRLRRDSLDSRDPQAALDSGDAVRLLTIHAAKGLEFPIVFISEAGDALARGNARTILWRAEDGISLTLENDPESGETSRRRPGFYNYLAGRDEVEDAAENKRVLYVAATRAADMLFVSGVEADSDKSVWIGAFADPGFSDGVVHYEPATVDLKALASPSRKQFALSAPEDEMVVDSPLIARPIAVPIRSSTPVTALKPPQEGHAFYGPGDPLALARGTLAHLAIEEMYRQKPGVRPDIRALAAQVGSIAAEDVDRLTAEVNEMLDLLAASELGATLDDPITNAYFELPFSWNWEGVAVHGSIDLVYEINGEWRVIDFKSDRTDGKRDSELAAPYLTQLGLYAGAIEAATGKAPEAGLFFLRTGKHYWPGRQAIAKSLRETRQRLSDGDLVDVVIDADQELADEATVASG